MKRHLAALSATSVLSALALTGCVSGSGGASSENAPTATPGQKVSITFSSYAFQDPTVKATQAIVDSWNAANPDIQVTYQKVDPNSVHDKLVTQFAGDQAPDVIHDEAADIAGFSQQGYLTDIGSMIPAELKSDVPQSVWDSVTFNGKITGVPTIAQVYNLFANTDALKKAGIALPTPDTPWTWDDLATNAKKLTAGNGVYGLAWGLKSPAAGFMNSGLAFDGTFFSGDETKPKITVGTNEMQVPTRVKAMIDDKVMAPNSISLSGTDVLPGFFGNKYALVMAGNYVAAQISEKAPAGFNWTMLPVLKGANQNQAANPQTLSVARQSKHPAEAVKFISYFMKAENLAKVAEGDALIPVATSAAAIVKKDLGSDHGWDNILGAPLVAAPWVKATKYPQWKSEIANPSYQEFLAGKIDAATLQKKLTDGWNSMSQ